MKQRANEAATTLLARQIHAACEAQTAPTSSLEPATLAALWSLYESLAPDAAASLKAAALAHLPIAPIEASSSPAPIAPALASVALHSLGSPPSAHRAARVLASAYESLLQVRASVAGSPRAKLGAVYTPRRLASSLTRDAFTRLAPMGVIDVLDPACGSGRFLLAALRASRRSGLPAPRLWGVDIDPCAVLVTRLLIATHPATRAASPSVETRIVWRDGLLATPPGPESFDLVLGNPPFLNQLERNSARARAEALAIRTLSRGVIRGYADTAGAFLFRAISLTKPAGIACMIQPLSILASRDAMSLRRWASTTSTLEHLWIGDTHAFAASVFACAVTLRKASPAPKLRILLSRGRSARALGHVLASPQTRWSVLGSRAAAMPPLALAPSSTLRDWVDATADFRDVYYALRPLITDAPANAPANAPTSHPSLVRVLNTGLVELAHTTWGRTPARLHRALWQRPAFDPTLAAQSPALSRVLPLRLRPKLILATQTRIIEAFVDDQGQWFPTTPLISLTPKPSAPSLWHIAAAVCSPVSTLIAARRTFGSSLNPKAIKLAASQVLDLPLPSDLALLNSAASSLRRAARAMNDADPDRYHACINDFARESTAAYALPTSDQLRIVDWYRSRRSTRKQPSQRPIL